MKIRDRLISEPVQPLIVFPVYMVRMNWLLKPAMILIILAFYSAGVLKADDPGITKVRLIQLSDSIYSLEADIPQLLLSSIKTPILPDGFSFVDFDFTDQAGWITLKGSIRSSGVTFKASDEIVLPWNRNGIDMTVQWKDGSVYKGLFRKTLGGIRIPMEKLMPTKKSTTEVLSTGVDLVFRHSGFLIIHIILIVLIVARSPSLQSLKKLVWYSFGQGFGMVFSEFIILEVDLLYSDILLVWLILLLSLANLYGTKFRFLELALLLVGIVHSIAFIHEIEVLPLPKIQILQAAFAFNICIDVLHITAALLTIFLATFIKQHGRFKSSVSWISGSLCIFILLMIFQENIITGNKDILALSKGRSTNYSAYANASNLAQTTSQRNAGVMKTPIMIFLVIEQFEVRLEVLAKAVILNPDTEKTLFIPVVEQDVIKEKANHIFINSLWIKINEQFVDPIHKNTGFVMLNRGGVTFRSNAVNEKTTEALIGSTYILNSKGFPDSLSFEWTYFPSDVANLEVSVIDAHSSVTMQMNPDNNQLLWKNSLVGYQVPVVEAIQVEPDPLPLLSVILWVIIIAYLLIMYSKKQLSVTYSWLFLFLFMSLILYPFVRTNAFSFHHIKPLLSIDNSGKIMEDLLNNVYQSFNRKEEAEVYDCLIQSVTEDQLTDIYMQNRRAMVMEDRGGARANVDVVEVTDIFSIDHEAENKYKVDVLWTVNGSVNHFGHTHYRQNQYRALVTIIADGMLWKISNIESYDVERIY